LCANVDIALYAPTDGGDFIVGKYDFRAWPGIPKRGQDQVYVGMFADWDIPSDTAVDNGSGYNAELSTIYQRGSQTATNDEDPPHSCPITEDLRFGGVALLSQAPRGAWTAENTPMQLGSGLDPDSLYDRMTVAGIDIYTAADDDSVTDLHTGICFDLVDMTAKEAHSYVFAMVSSNTGLESYEAQVAEAFIWAEAQGLISTSCDCVPGDANGDGQINVGDAVYIITYVFKGGAAPTPFDPCSGDANGDCQCNVGDAVYIISYVFKGGAAPVDCETWTGSCGSYE
jgi:hypothetical protein